MDDQFIFQTAFSNLNYSNEVIYFTDGLKALDFLNDVKITPFLIFSDVNMPLIDGFALREQINTTLQLQNKCIPFILFSGMANRQSVIDAYNRSVQGYFTKKDSIEDFQKTIKAIIEYWNLSLSPNNFK